jgi:hypothetical protein
MIRLGCEECFGLRERFPAPGQLGVGVSQLLPRWTVGGNKFERAPKHRHGILLPAGHPRHAGQHPECGGIVGMLDKMRA